MALFFLLLSDGVCFSSLADCFFFRLLSDGSFRLLLMVQFVFFSF